MKRKFSHSCSVTPPFSSHNEIISMGKCCWWVFGKKPKNKEETHVDTQRACTKTPQKVTQFRIKPFWSWPNIQKKEKDTLQTYLCYSQVNHMEQAQTEVMMFCSGVEQGKCEERCIHWSTRVVSQMVYWRLYPYSTLSTGLLKVCFWSM